MYAVLQTGQFGDRNRFKLVVRKVLRRRHAAEGRTWEDS